MYLTAASAAWRYSGKVTGPDSMLTRPTVIGLPVAFFGVPRAAEVSGVADADDFVLLLSDDLELLLPHPAPNRLAATATARAGAHLLVTFTCLSPLPCGVVVRGPRSGPPRRGSSIATAHGVRAGPRRGPRARAGRG